MTARDCCCGGRPNDAAKAYSRLLELDPKSAAAAFNRGRAYSMLGNHGKAARDFGQVLTLAPGNPYAALRLHLAEMRSGAGAGKALEAALGALGKDVWRCQLLLVSRRAKGEDVLAALAQVPDQDRARIQCEANYYLGALADAKGETKAARALYQAAVKTGAGASVEFIDAGLALAAR
jgi:lipoprotein NlpI